MGTSFVECPFSIKAHFNGNSRILSPEVKVSTVKFPSSVEFSTLHFFPSSAIISPSKECSSEMHAVPDEEKATTPILDTIESPMHLKNLSVKELRQLADDIRSELSFIMSKTQKPFRASLAVVELTVAIHHVFHAPVDKILWDVEEHTYPHKLLTGRRALMQMHGDTNNLSGLTSKSIFDPIGAGHGCNSISAGLGMAVARDINGKRDRVVAVISNETTMAGQVYEAMGNAGFLDSDMVVVLNDSRHSLHPKLEETPKTPINALSSSLSKLQSSKFFRKFREVAKGLTKRIGRGMHEWAAKVDEYARGLLGPPGSTLFEELGLYYIGPVDGHNIEDLVCVLHEVASLDSMGPVLIHVITKEGQVGETDRSMVISDTDEEGSRDSDLLPSSARPRTYSDCFVEALILEAERDKDIVAVHAGMGMEPSLGLFKDSFPEKFFDVGMAEQHAVTFSAGLACGGMKPFCIIPSAFLQRAYDQVGKGKILIEGKNVALLGYGSMVQNCLRAQSLLAKLGVEITVADARFCKPLDIHLVRQLCENHAFLITVEEGAIGGFGSHVAQFISLDGQLDAGIKWRPIVLPDTYIECASPQEQLAVAGLTGNHIAATTLSLLGRPREALLLMC